MRMKHSKINCSLIGFTVVTILLYKRDAENQKTEGGFEQGTAKGN